MAKRQSRPRATEKAMGRRASLLRGGLIIAGVIAVVAFIGAAFVSSGNAAAYACEDTLPATRR